METPQSWMEFLVFNGCMKNGKNDHPPISAIKKFQIKSWLQIPFIFHSSHEIPMEISAAPAPLGLPCVHEGRSVEHAQSRRHGGQAGGEV